MHATEDFRAEPSAFKRFQKTVGELDAVIGGIVEQRDELLAALKAVVASHGGLCQSAEMKHALAVIAKAEGR
jgi:hypothetical protein